MPKRITNKKCAAGKNTLKENIQFYMNKIYINIYKNNSILMAYQRDIISNNSSLLMMVNK